MKSLKKLLCLFGWHDWIRVEVKDKLNQVWGSSSLFVKSYLVELRCKQCGKMETKEIL